MNQNTLLVWKHACFLCSSMSCCVKEGGCWKSQWQEHRCCVYNIHSSMERSCHSLPLGQWDSKTLPFCCSDKTFIFAYFPTWVQSKPQWFLFLGSFIIIFLFLTCVKTTVHILHAFIKCLFWLDLIKLCTNNLLHYYSMSEMDYVPFWSMSDGPFSKIELNIKILDLNIWTMALTVWHDMSRAHRISSLLAVRIGKESRAHVTSIGAIMWWFSLFLRSVCFVCFIAFWWSSSGTSCCIWVTLNIIHTYTRTRLQSAMQTTPHTCT